MHVPPKMLLIVRKSKYGALEHAQYCKDRSEQTERLENVQTTEKNINESNFEQDLIMQTASLVKRNKDIYIKAVEKAGLKISGKLKLSPEGGQKIKAEVPLTVWRLIKGTISQETGVAIFGSEKHLREKLQQQEFECGTYTSNPDKTGKVQKVPFLRVVNIVEVIKNTIHQFMAMVMIPGFH